MIVETLCEKGHLYTSHVSSKDEDVRSCGQCEAPVIRQEYVGEGEYYVAYIEKAKA